MKLLIIFTILLASLQGHSQGDVIAAYIHNPDSVINKIANKTIMGIDKKDLRAIALDLQNRGQMLDEKEHEYKNSLELINKALIVFEYLDDTLSIANNKKFKGYLLGRLERFDEAKKEIKQAIDLYRSKNTESGVAVSEFDLSRVYDFENKLDSAIYYCSSGLTYWKSQNNISRIVLNQTMLIHLLIRDKQLLKAKPIQEESEQLSTNTRLHSQDLIDFYLVSVQLYRALNDAELSTKYRALYHNKMFELKKQNIVARSYYDSSS